MKRRSYDNFYEEVPAGVQEPATPAAPASPEPGAPTDPAAPGEPPVTTPEPKDQTVPFSRFQEVNDSLKQTREEFQAFRDNLVNAVNPKSEPTGGGLDPEVEAELDRYMEQRGYVKAGELQARSDLQTLGSKYNLSPEEVTNLAKKADELGVRGADGLEATYRFLNQDKIVENAVKEALARGGQAPTAEKPGTGGAAPPKTEEAKPGDTKGRIKAAIAKYTQ